MLTRRAFLQHGAMAVVGTAAIPSFLTRAAWGAVTTAANKRLVVIFQRGAADGLNIVVPHAEPSYYAMRPSIAIPRNQVIDLERLLRPASVAGALQAAVGPGTPRHRARRRLARHDALALRRAGLHGVRHARREEHDRRLAQSRAAERRRRRRHVPSARSRWALRCRAFSPARRRRSRSAT